MRTTVTIPDNLFKEARKFIQADSAAKTVIIVFKEFLKQRKIQTLIDQAGKVTLDLSQDTLQELRHSR